MSSKSFELKTNSVMANIANKVNSIESKIDYNFRSIDSDLIVPNEKNFYGMRDIEELAQDIKENGLYHNIVVIPIEDGKFKIISGERRYKALNLLGQRKIPCQVRDDVDDIDSEIMLIQANAKTRELSEIEKAEQVARLEQLYNEKKARGEKITGKVRDKIGEDMGLSGMQVQRYKKINELIPELKQMLEDKSITMTNAVDFASFNEEQQKSVWQFLSQNINVSKEEINSLKETLKNHDEEYNKEKEELKNERDKLSTRVVELKGIVDEKNKEVESINKNIESTKEKLKEEISKEVENRNKEEIEKLQNDLQTLEQQQQQIEEEKNNLVKEKNTKIDELESNLKEHEEKQSVNMENIRLNAELKILIKSIEKSSLELVDVVSKTNDKIISKENIELLKKYKDLFENKIESILNKM